MSRRLRNKLPTVNKLLKPNKLNLNKIKKDLKNRKKTMIKIIKMKKIIKQGDNVLFEKECFQ